ncbi:hypothetical protein HUJ04_013295 [Dendroctonus ponderosae]|nr:hypothetical protein HUJ04_013295 [Dendroctonus ponderosae]
MKLLAIIPTVLRVLLLLSPPFSNASFKRCYLLLVLLLQSIGVGFAILKPLPNQSYSSRTKVHQIMRGKNLFLILGVCLVNYIITLQLVRKRIAWKPPVNSCSTRATQLVSTLWALLKLWEGVLVLSGPTSFGIYSVFFMLVRAEGALLYICGEMLQLVLQLQQLQDKLKLWRPLDGVMQLSWQHSRLLSAIENSCNICGPIIASSSCFCLIMLLDDFSNLTMLQKFQTKTAVYIWTVHTLVAFFINIIFLASVGEKLATTMRATVAICQKMGESLDRALILSEREELRFQYQLIALESHHRNPKLHAIPQVMQSVHSQPPWYFSKTKRPFRSRGVAFHSIKVLHKPVPAPIERPLDKDKWWRMVVDGPFRIRPVL